MTASRRSRGPGPSRQAKPTETVLLTGVTQGAGKSVTIPIGTGKGGGNARRRKQVQRSVGSACWDAFHPAHLPLPRAVAPYAVVRTTEIWNPSSDNERRFALFAPTAHTGLDGGAWSNVFALGPNVALSSQKDTANGINKYTFTSMNSTSWQAATVTPAAFSIQIMNPEALQTSTGMVYVGRCKNKVNMSEGVLTDSFESLAEQLVSYSNPRICSAGKLALRGVQVDAVPNNMSLVSNFTTLNQQTDGNFTLAATNVVQQEGFNPIFVYNPDAVDLQILVCCEWRVRFDPSNPAYAACRSHKPSTDHQWWKHMEHAAKLGNGAIDIADKVSRYGMPLLEAGMSLAGAAA